MATSRDAVVAAYAGPGEKSQMARIFDEFIGRATSQELEQVFRECRDRVLAEAVKEGEPAVKVDVRRSLVGDPAISIYELAVEGKGGRWKITCGSREQLRAMIDGMRVLGGMFGIYMPDTEIP